MSGLTRRVEWWAVLIALSGTALSLNVARAQVSPARPAPAVESAERSITALDRFLTNLRSWETEFQQTITDARGREQLPQTGRLWVQRPGRFRWELGSPEPLQVMVADGANLWFFDRDLEQVTVRRASESLTLTPASLLAGGVPLREGFSLESMPRRSGVDWVQVTPKAEDAEFREARLGFEKDMLKRMELFDKLGQQVVLEFSRSRRNQALDAGVLRFVVPAGADLIGTPVEP